MAVNSERWAYGVAIAGLVLVAGGFSGWFLTGWAPLRGTPLYLMLAGAIVLLLYSAVDHRKLGSIASDKRFGQGLISTMLTVMAAVVAFGLFIFADKNDKTFDLTSEKSFTLSDHSVGILQGLEEDVELLAFFREQTLPEVEFRKLWSRYENLGSKAQVRYVDPLTNPQLAEQYDITGRHGTVVIKRGEKTRTLEMPISETALTSAIVMVSTDGDHQLCWSVGHGEPDPDDEVTDRGFGSIVIGAEEHNYQFLKVEIARQGVPRSCEALVIVNPRNRFYDYEKEAIAAYVAEGGSMLVLLEPRYAPDFSASLARYGLAVGDDVVVDFNTKNRMLGVADHTAVVLSGDDLLGHAITEPMGAAIVMPGARSVSRVEGGVEGLRIVRLLQTSQDAWAETDITSDGIAPDPGELVGEVPLAQVVRVTDPSALAVVTDDLGEPEKDQQQANTDKVDVVANEMVEQIRAALQDADPGSVKAQQYAKLLDELQAAVTTISTPMEMSVDGQISRAIPPDFQPKPGGRVVVLGDADFVNNVFIAQGNNSDLFLNSLAWLVDETDQLGQRPKAKDRLELTASNLDLVFLVSAMIVPGAVALMALFAWFRRRRL